MLLQRLNTLSDRANLVCSALGSHCLLAYAYGSLSNSMRIAAGNQNTDSLPRPPTISDPQTRKHIHVANIKSQIKRIGTNKKAQDRNRQVKSQVKTAIRATREAIKAGDKETAIARLKAASKSLDKAAGKGVLHKNQAANRKSAMAKQVAAL